MLDAFVPGEVSEDEYEAFIRENKLTDLELAAAYYVYGSVPEFKTAFKKEYELRNNKSFDVEAEERILDTIKDSHIASAILFDKDLDKARNLREEYFELGLES